MERRDATLLEARMAVLSELALGAAHALNNALTAIGGEASFLQSESKDAAVQEGCGVILEQVQRCARLTHALLRRRAPLADGPRECELGPVLDGVAQALADALPRRLQLHVEPCPPLALALPAAECETLALLLVQRAALRLPRTGTLRLAAREACGEALLELRAAGLEAPGPLDAVYERLLRELALASGGALALVLEGGEECARIALPRLRDVSAGA
jgi:nitrogen-specific signal transduction histidine kinase